MAYNPFNVFRRNQKALFAVLTVFIMIMFTLSFGAGDFFDQVPRWLGAGGRGEVVCKIDGNKITTGDLEQGPKSVQFRRVLANRFMTLAANQTISTLGETINSMTPRLGQEASRTAHNAMMAAQFWQLGMITPEQASDLRQTAYFLSLIMDDPNTSSEHKEVARAAQTIYLLIDSLLAGRGTHYFVNAPSQHRRDLIEFVLWQYKADQLGIRFTRDDVKKLIQTEFNHSFVSDVQVRKAMQQQMQGYTYEATLDAIAEEFRVRTAQMAVLGQFARANRPASYPIPYEAFEFYREQCSPATYQLVAVPAEAFEPFVQGQPTESEMKEMFRAGENLEPDPRRETPGFTEPRRIAIAFLGITGDEPYYKKLAEEQINIGEKMAKAWGLLTVPLPGTLETWAAGAVAPMQLQDPAVQAAYDAYVARFNNIVRNDLSSHELMARDILDSNVVRPGVLAASLGGFLGQAAGFGNPASAASTTVSAAMAYEIRTRISLGLPLMLGMIPGPDILSTMLAGTAAGKHYEPKPLPIDFMRPELIKTTVDDRAKALAFGDRGSFSMMGGNEKGDVQRFIDELKAMTENGKPKDKAAIEKYIEDFITTRGLDKPREVKGKDATVVYVGRSSSLRDEWNIENDPNLKPLIEAHQESSREATMFHKNEYFPFGHTFFWTRLRQPTPDNPAATRRGPSTSGLYQAERFPPQMREPTSDKPMFLVWRTEDVQPQKRNFDSAEEAIKAAWRHNKARDLAQNRANAMAEAIRNSQHANEIAIRTTIADEVRRLQDSIPNEKQHGRMEPFTITEVAPWNSTMTIDQRMGQLRYIMTPFQLPPSRNIPYPTPEMRTALLEHRDKDPKTVLVMHDAGRNTYYVATLLRRDLKTTTDFKEDVHSRVGKAQEMLVMFYLESATNARKAAVEMLKKEFRYEETEEQTRKLDENVKSGVRD